MINKVDHVYDENTLHVIEHHPMLVITYNPFLVYTYNRMNQEMINKQTHPFRGRVVMFFKRGREGIGVILWHFHYVYQSH